MIKWFFYIVFLLALSPCLLLAKVKTGPGRDVLTADYPRRLNSYYNNISADTTKKAQVKTVDPKVKEIPKPKKQTKPEKVDDADNKAKPKRERRPDGMQRPPEIPRRNDN